MALLALLEASADWACYAIVEDRYTPLATCRYPTRAFVNRTKNTNGLLNCLEQFHPKSSR